MDISLAKDSPKGKKRKFDISKFILKDRKEDTASSKKSCPTAKPVHITPRGCKSVTQPKKNPSGPLFTESKNPSINHQPPTAEKVINQSQVPRKGCSKEKKVKSPQFANSPTPGVQNAVPEPSKSPKKASKSNTRKATKKKEQEDEDEPYDVERIVDKKIINGRACYMIKWTGYPEDDNSWEPVENCNCHELIFEFEKREREERHRLRLANRGFDPDRPSQEEPASCNESATSTSGQAENTDVDSPENPSDVVSEMSTMLQVLLSLKESLPDEQLQDAAIYEDFEVGRRIGEKADLLDADDYLNEKPTEIIGLSISEFGDPCVFARWENRSTMNVTFVAATKMFPELFLSWLVKYVAKQAGDAGCSLSALMDAESMEDMYALLYPDEKAEEERVEAAKQKQADKVRQFLHPKKKAPPKGSASKKKRRTETQKSVPITASTDIMEGTDQLVAAPVDLDTTSSSGTQQDSYSGDVVMSTINIGLQKVEEVPRPSAPAAFEKLPEVNIPEPVRMTEPSPLCELEQSLENDQRSLTPPEAKLPHVSESVGAFDAEMEFEDDRIGAEAVDVQEATPVEPDSQTSVPETVADLVRLTAEEVDEVLDRSFEEAHSSFEEEPRTNADTPMGMDEPMDVVEEDLETPNTDEFQNSPENHHLPTDPRSASDSLLDVTHALDIRRKIVTEGVTPQKPSGVESASSPGETPSKRPLLRRESLSLKDADIEIIDELKSCDKQWTPPTLRTKLKPRQPLDSYAVPPSFNASGDRNSSRQTAFSNTSQNPHVSDGQSSDTPCSVPGFFMRNALLAAEKVKLSSTSNDVQVASGDKLPDAAANDSGQRLQTSAKAVSVSTVSVLSSNVTEPVDQPDIPSHNAGMKESPATRTSNSTMTGQLPERQVPTETAKTSGDSPKVPPALDSVIGQASISSRLPAAEATGAVSQPKGSSSTSCIESSILSPVTPSADKPKNIPLVRTPLDENQPKLPHPPPKPVAKIVTQAKQPAPVSASTSITETSMRRDMQISGPNGIFAFESHRKQIQPTQKPAGKPNEVHRVVHPVGQTGGLQKQTPPLPKPVSESISQPKPRPIAPKPVVESGNQQTLTSARLEPQQKAAIASKPTKPPGDAASGNRPNPPPVPSKPNQQVSVPAAHQQPTNQGTTQLEANRSRPRSPSRSTSASVAQKQQSQRPLAPKPHAQPAVSTAPAVAKGTQSTQGNGTSAASSVKPGGTGGNNGSLRRPEAPAARHVKPSNQTAIRSKAPRYDPKTSAIAVRYTPPSVLVVQTNNTSQLRQVADYSPSHFSPPNPPRGPPAYTGYPLSGLGPRSPQPLRFSPPPPHFSPPPAHFSPPPAHFSPPSGGMQNQTAFPFAPTAPFGGPSVNQFGSRTLSGAAPRALAPNARRVVPVPRAPLNLRPQNGTRVKPHELFTERIIQAVRVEFPGEKEENIRRRCMDRWSRLSEHDRAQYKQEAARLSGD